MGLNLASKKAQANGKLEIEDADQIDDQIMQFIGLDQFGGTVRSSAPTQGKFWTKVVASVLSETSSGQAEGVS